MNLVLLLSEIFLLIACLVLALFWIVNPKGDYEPLIAYFAALLAIIEFARRKIVAHSSAKDARQQDAELSNAPVSLNESMDSIKDQLENLQAVVDSYNRSIIEASKSNETQSEYQSLDVSSCMSTAHNARHNNTGVKIRDKIKIIKIQPDGSALSITSNKGINFQKDNDHLANTFSDTLGLDEQYAYMGWSSFHSISEVDNEADRQISWAPLYSFLEQLTGRNQYDIELREIEKVKGILGEEEFCSELKVISGPCFFITKDNFCDLMPNVNVDSALDVCTIDSLHQTARLHLFIDYPGIDYLPDEANISIMAADREGVAKKSRLEMSRGNFELDNEEQKCINEKVSLVQRRDAKEIIISIANPNPSVVYVIRWKLPNDQNMVKLASADNKYFYQLRASLGNQESLDTRDVLARIAKEISSAFGDEKVNVHLVGRTQERWEVIFGDDSINDLIMRISDKALRTRRVMFSETFNPWDNNNFNNYLSSSPYSFLALPVLYPRIDPVKWKMEYGDQVEKTPLVACVICISFPKEQGMIIKENMSDALLGLYSIISVNINTSYKGGMQLKELEKVRNNIT